MMLSLVVCGVKYRPRMVQCRAVSHETSAVTASRWSSYCNWQAVFCVADFYNRVRISIADTHCNQRSTDCQWWG